MEHIKKYKFWIENEYFDEETKKELRGIEGNEAEVEDRFYKELEFGTGGLRGKIGAGTNRINKYTVARSTQGLAKFIIDNLQFTIDNERQKIKANEKNENISSKDYRSRGVVIAYDSRYKSREFAETAALVLAGNGIKAYLFKNLRPTPELSFAVRYLNAVAGIVITASHNPPEYNGYKVYWEDGAQMVPSLANQVIDRINNIENFSDIKILEKEKAIEEGLLKIIGSEIDDIYIDKVKKLSVRSDINKDIKIIYTPLHGSGNIPVRRVLNELGFINVTVVKEQEKPDPQFSTVDYPNPEDPNAFKLAMDLGEKIDADILLGTDPDCDRVGVVVKDNTGKYIVLSGNQTGALLLDYILEGKKDELPTNGTMIKTIVTSEIGRVIASHYKIDTIDTLTGFKFIGEKMKEFEQKGDREFIFGYEESFGYLTGTFVRDKDAVIASMLICEMAAYYKSKGLNLYEALQELYNKYGFFIEDLHAIKLEGIEGKKKIDKVMENFRHNIPAKIGELEIVTFNDYKIGKSYRCRTGENEDIDLPRSNVLKYIFEDESWFTLRPSGTEPKLKIYIAANGADEGEARRKVKGIKDEVLDKINETY